MKRVLEVTSHESIGHRSVMRCLAFVSLTTTAAMIGGVACGGVVDDDPPEDHQPHTASVASEIRNGEVVTAGYAEMVKLTLNQFGCSGELVTNRFVLTAKHCIWPSPKIVDERAPIDPATVWSPSSVLATMGAGDVEQSSKADLILWHPSLDVALVRLEHPLTVNGSTMGYVRRVRSSYVWAGEWVECYGYGNNDVDSAGNETGWGALRHSTNYVAWSLYDHFGITANIAGQIIMEGDSGGACFSGAEIAGVTSTGDSVTSAQLVAGPSFKPWLDDILSHFSNGNDTDDGLKIRDALGRIFVMMGDGALWIQSWDEYVRDWSDGAMLQTGPFGLSEKPRDGTLLRQPTGEIDVVYAGAHFHVPNMDEFYALGFTPEQLRAAPAGSFDRIGVVPRDGVTLRDHGTGEIDLMSGGKRWWIKSLTTYQRSFSSLPLYSVPTGSLAPIPFGGVIAAPRPPAAVRRP